MNNVRENLLISSLVCITAGAFFTVAGIMSIAGTVGISGVVLFILGMTMSTQQGMSKKEIEEWVPDSSQLPDAGRVMYRVDVTIDEPKKCTVMCGPCGHVELLDGWRPPQFTCPACSKILWDEEE